MEKSIYEKSAGGISGGSGPDNRPEEKNRLRWVAGILISVVVVIVLLIVIIKSK